MSPFTAIRPLAEVMEIATLVGGWGDAVEAVYREDADRLWRAVAAWAGDAETASEAVAEAYAQLLARGPSVRDPAAWVWRTAFRIAAGALQERRATATATQPAGVHLDHHTDPDLLAALAKLPGSQRAAVILFYYADLPVSEIAQRLGSNRLAIRANLSRGRRRLAHLIGDPS